ncbi:MAG: cytochrome c-type biogenesis protein CcmH [Acidimicrobiales bacterium]
MRVLRSFWLFAAALVVVFALALSLNQGQSSAAARVAHLESLVKCPSCEDLSVAQSNATTAVAVRHEIAADVAAGKSDDQILTSIEDAYGPSILLSPPTSGLGVLLWLGPLVVVLVLVAALWRLRKRWR